MGLGAQAVIEQSGVWEVVTPASLGIVTFRHRAEHCRDSARVQRAIEQMLQSRYALITTTEVCDEKVLRLCPIHPAARLSEIRESLVALNDYIQAE